MNLRGLTTKLLSALFRGPLGKLARHGIAAVTAWLVAQPALADQPAPDSGSLWSVLVLALVWIGVTVWSLAAKTEPSAQAKSVMRRFAEAAASHIAPLIAGGAAAHGYTGGEDSLVELAEWAVLFFGNLILSFSSRPDAPADQDPGTRPPDYGDDPLDPSIGQYSLGLLLLLAAPFLLGLTSCSAPFVREWRPTVCVGLPSIEELTALTGDEAGAK